MPNAVIYCSGRPQAYAKDRFSNCVSRENISGDKSIMLCVRSLYVTLDKWSLSSDSRLISNAVRLD